jgi:hypothetical protein
VLVNVSTVPFIPRKPVSYAGLCEAIQRLYNERLGVGVAFTAQD